MSLAGNERIGDRFDPTIVKSYPPPAEPLEIDKLVMKILYSKSEAGDEGIVAPAVVSTTTTS